MERDSRHMRVCALVLSVASFFLFIAAETLQFEGARAHRVVLTLVALGALGFAWIGPLTLLAGSLRSPAFKWWQPFEGGVEFVWMQAFGWSLDALVLAASAVVLANFRVREWFQGLYLLLGVTGFCAQILLNLSLSVFAEQDARQPEFQFRLNTKAVVSLLLSASGTLMFVVYDAFSHLVQSSVVVTLACAQFTISAAIIHVVYGCLEIPGYKFWQPFQGDRMFLLLQYLGWQFFACMIAGSIILCVDPDADTFESRAYSIGTPTVIGMMGFISQVLLLISLQFFRHETSATETARQATANSFLPRTKRQPPEVLVAALLSVSALFVGLLSHASRTVEWASHYPAIQTFRHHERVWWGIGICALIMASPVAQMGAVRTDHAFRWFQPFAGGTQFIFLQMIGWFWYATFLALVVVLWMNSRFIGEPLSICVLVLGFASAFSIATSLPYFTAPRPNPKVKTKEPFAARSDLAMFLIFALMCAFFHIMVDVFHERMAAGVRVVCVALGTGSSLLGCGIAHMSGRRYFLSYRFWQPFEGGTRFVIRQAVGWTLFAVQLLFDSLLLLIIAWQRAPAGVPSLIGLFSLMPHFLIVSSIACFRSEPAVGRRVHATGTIGWSELWYEAPIRWRLIVNMVVAVGSMGLFVGAEVVHGSGRIQFAEEVLYLFGFLSSLCGMSLAHCVLGPKMHPAYRLFQPFRGGTRFITLQGAAWTLMSMGWAVACTVLFWSDEFFRVKGIHAMTGLMFFVAQVVLLCSLPLFKTHSLNETKSGGMGEQTGFRSQAEDWVNQFLVGPLLGIAACSVFVIVDLGMVYFGPSVPAFPVTLCAVLALFSSIPMSYSMASSRLGARAKEFSGSIVFVVAGCALWSFTLLLAVVFSYNLWTLENGISSTVTISKSPTAYMGTFTGTIGFVAQLLLLQASGSRGSRADTAMWGSLEKPLMLIQWVEGRAGAVAVWVYSFGAVIAWATYCYLRAMIPRHLATSQVFSLFACTAVVIVSAWWIQHHILSGDSSVANSVHSKTSLVSPSPLPEDDQPALRLGVDCYLHLVLLLSTSDVIALSKCCRSLRTLFTEQFWRDVFYHRLLQRGNLASHHTTDMKVWESTHYSSFNLRMPLSHTMLTRIEDVIFTAVCRLELPSLRFFPKEIPGIRSSRWKALCEGDGHDFLLKQCVVCDQWDLFSARGLEWEMKENCMRRTPSTWIVVCRCQEKQGNGYLRSAHRTCVEKSCDGLLPDTSGGCNVCSANLVEDTRLPTTSELVLCTWEDIWTFRQDFGGGFFVVVPSCSAVLSTTLRSFGWGSPALYAWMALAVAICFIAHSPWFDQRLRRLGSEDSPSFLAYQRLYHTLMLSSMAHLFLCSPYMSLFDQERSALVQVAANAGFYANFVVILLVGGTTLVVYWRSQYPVKTLREELIVNAADRDTEARQPSVDEAPARITQSCILCQLLVCNDD